jgi:hypothetical protein
VGPILEFGKTGDSDVSATTAPELIVTDSAGTKTSVADSGGLVRVVISVLVLEYTSTSFDVRVFFPLV